MLIQWWLMRGCQWKDQFIFWFFRWLKTRWHRSLRRWWQSWECFWECEEIIEEVDEGSSWWWIKVLSISQLSSIQELRQRHRKWLQLQLHRKNLRRKVWHFSLFHCSLSKRARRNFHHFSYLMTLLYLN